MLMKSLVWCIVVANIGIFEVKPHGECGLDGGRGPSSSLACSD